jgi:hypothetical protein
MRRTLSILAVLALAPGLVACGDDDGGSNNVNQSNQNNANQNTQQDGGVQPDGATQQDAAVPADAAAPLEDYLGSDCTCEGTGCEQMGVPKPAGGTIVGCDGMPEEWPGAAAVCLRSYSGESANQTYFANGYCSLMATSCTGESFICNSATFGEYDNMTACPAGTVMIQDSQHVDVIGLTAEVSNKTCALGCTDSSQCRPGEIDPVWSDAAAQYQCVDKGGVRFCYDPRNLSETYTATAF